MQRIDFCPQRGTTQRAAHALKEAASSLRISLRTLHRLVAADAFPTLKIGRRRLVSPSTLTSYLAEREHDGLEGA